MRLAPAPDTDNVAVSRREQSDRDLLLIQIAAAAPKVPARDISPGFRAQRSRAASKRTTSTSVCHH
jgi:hypothetical protein